MRLSLERLQISDASSLHQLSRSIGWPMSLADWRTNLEAGIAYGHRDETGRLVSSSILHVYPALEESAAGLASLGIVIVHPERQRQGIGRAVIERCLEETTTPVMLVSTPEGERLYQKLGFREVGRVQNLVAPQGARLPVENHQTIQESDFGKILGFDRRVFGADREKLLRVRWAQAAGGSFLPGRDLFDWPRGFGWKIRQEDRLILGPIVAPDTAGALQLVGNLAAGHPGMIRLDVPDQQAEFLEGLIEAGFVRQSLRPVMLRGADRLPGDRDRLFAVAALACG